MKPEVLFQQRPLCLQYGPFQLEGGVGGRLRCKLRQSSGFFTLFTQRNNNTHFPRRFKRLDLNFSVCFSSLTKERERERERERRIRQSWILSFLSVQPKSGPNRATQTNAVVTSHTTSHNDKFTHLTDDRSIQPTVTPRQRRHFGSRSVSAERTTILIR